MQVEESKNERARPLARTIKKELVKNHNIRYIEVMDKEKNNNNYVYSTKENSNHESIDQLSSPDESKTTKNI